MANQPTESSPMPAVETRPSTREIPVLEDGVWITGPDGELIPDYDATFPTINEGEVLQIVSEMEGEISIDANPDRTFDFPPGCIASFRLHDSKLNVVRDIIPKQ